MSLLPLAKRIATNTVAENLVNVQPLPNTYNIDISSEIKRIEERLKIENRDNYLDSILNDTEFKYKYLEDDKEYKDLYTMLLI